MFAKMLEHDLECKAEIDLAVLLIWIFDDLTRTATRALKKSIGLYQQAPCRKVVTGHSWGNI